MALLQKRIATSLSCFGTLSFFKPGSHKICASIIGGIYHQCFSTQVLLWLGHLDHQFFANGVRRDRMGRLSVLGKAINKIPHRKNNAKAWIEQSSLQGRNNFGLFFLSPNNGCHPRHMSHTTRQRQERAPRRGRWWHAPQTFAAPRGCTSTTRRSPSPLHKKEQIPKAP